MDSIEALLRLNQAGRGYLIGDAPSARSGFKLLYEARDDLDCLFTHLLENPSLCEAMRRKKKKGKKRTRAAYCEGFYGYRDLAFDMLINQLQ
jgi:hypothetical protein